MQLNKIRWLFYVSSFYSRCKMKKIYAFWCKKKGQEYPGPWVSLLCHYGAVDKVKMPSLPSAAVFSPVMTTASICTTVVLSAS